MPQKPSIPKGTRDFGSAEMARRNYIFDTIRRVYSLYGFQQIETPAMENLSTLLGKYGEEGDRLLFKVLNSGDFLRDVTPEDMQGGASGALASRLCEKGLRYDLTVPFARYVAQHRSELPMPFRRYQIQPVWRADRPQRGRYREFFQCDADVVGSDSLLNEVELLQLLDAVFVRFGISVCVKVNNRKVLSAIAEMVGESSKLTAITVAIDKLEKVGLPGVEEEMRGCGVSESAIEALRPVLGLSGDNYDKIRSLRRMLADVPIGQRGLDEIEFVLRSLEGMGMSNEVVLDAGLARGLNYYTGCIFEVKALGVQMGSIAGGGRYDNLTGIFGSDGLSGVGVSFGADRIYDVLETLDLYPAELATSTRLLFVNFGQAEAAYCLRMVNDVRGAGVSCELYPDSVRMKRQLQYANDKGIPFVALVGEEEMRAGKVALRDMSSGEQRLMTIGEVVSALREGR